jgi:hypothetical protein
VRQAFQEQDYALSFSKCQITGDRARWLPTGCRRRRSIARLSVLTLMAGVHGLTTINPDSFRARDAAAASTSPASDHLEHVVVVAARAAHASSSARATGRGGCPHSTNTRGGRVVAHAHTHEGALARLQQQQLDLQRRRTDRLIAACARDVEVDP